jgi:hypothetical protein
MGDAAEIRRKRGRWNLPAAYDHSTLRRPDDSLDDVAVGVNEILAMLSGLSSVACASSDRRMPRHGAVPHWRLLKRSAAVALQRCWSRFLRSRTVEISRTPRPQRMEISQSEVDWVINLAGQPVGQPDPKNPTALRGPVGVWNCEVSDRIRR